MCIMLRIADFYLLWNVFKLSEKINKEAEND